MLGLRPDHSQPAIKVLVTIDSKKPLFTLEKIRVSMLPYLWSKTYGYNKYQAKNSTAREPSQ